MKIYTRTGDDGTTGLFGGGRVSKNAPRIRACGALDELNASIGVARAALPGSGEECPGPAGRPTGADADLEALLARIQANLFDVGAELASPPGAKASAHVRGATREDVRTLEEAIDQFEKELEPLRQFVLPGGSPFAARIHLARSVCRRAEREIVALGESEPVGAPVLAFMNRLSDLLFVVARAANSRAGRHELKWTARGGPDSPA